MITKFLLLLALCLATVTAIQGAFPQRRDLHARLDASEQGEAAYTNAERFKRGLPPLRPSRRALTRSPHQPRASPPPCPVPLTNTEGRIRVDRVSDNAVLGYLDNIGPTTSYGVTNDSFQMRTVSVPSASSFGTPIDLTSTNGPNTPWKLIGGVPGLQGGDLSDDTPGSVWLVTVEHTDADTPATNAGHTGTSLGTNRPSESQIWTLDCITRELTIQWTNSDDTQNPNFIAYGPGSASSLGTPILRILGDIEAYNAALQTFLEHVKFTFDPLPL